jgi:hypothetical protein
MFYLGVFLLIITIGSGLILFYFILFYFILFYFILFYWEDVTSIWNTYLGIDQSNIESLISTHTPSSSHSPKYENYFQNNELTLSTASSVSFHSTSHNTFSASSITVRGLQVNTQINK